MIQEVENIEAYIEEKSDEEVRIEGQQMSKVIDNFGAPNIEISSQMASFRIMGTYFYTVTVRNFLSNIHTDCTCPDEREGLCKHEVAVLIYLSDYLKKNSHKLFTPSLPKSNNRRIMGKRNSSEPYIIKDYQNINTQTIFDHTYPFRPSRSNGTEVINFEHRNQTVTFELMEKSIYRKKAEKTYKTSFTKSANGLVTKCNCKTETERLCTHQVSSLWYIIQKLGGDFFEILQPNYVKDRFRQWAEKTGISQEAITDYYTFDIKTRKFVPKAKALGLVQFNTEGDEQIGQKLNPATLKNDSYVLPTAMSVNEKSVVPGYVFSFEDPTQVKLIPITGVPLDDVWLKYISEFSQKTLPLQWDDADDEIIAIIGELEKLGAETWQSGRNPKLEKGIKFHKSYYKKLNRLFVLMEGKEYLFYRPAHFSGKIKRSQLTPLNLSNLKAELFFEIGEADIFYTLESKLKIGDKTMNLSHPDLALEDALPFFSLVLHKNTLYLHQSLQQAYTLHELKEDKPVFKCIKRDFPLFFEQIVTPLAQSYPMDFSQFTAMEKEVIALQAEKRQLYISELSNFILFKPVVQYDHGQQVNVRSQNTLVAKNENHLIIYQRDQGLEKAYENFMEGLHPEFKKQRFSEFFFLPYTSLQKNNWFFKVFEKFTEENIEVFGISDLKNISYSPHKASIKSHIKSGEDWFEVDVQVAFGDEFVKLADIRKAVIKNERFVKLSDGKMGLLPDSWFGKLQKFFRSGEFEDGELKISKMKFSIIDELFEEIDDQEIIMELREKKRKLLDFKSIQPKEIPSQIRAELRDYQLEGFNWLNFLDEFKWGGILADDMGLGKTLQILTFLQSQVNQQNGTNLVVVPTSLLFNWENEIEKFAPELKYKIHHGLIREQDSSTFKDYDIIITTYGLIANDIELFSGFRFNYIVLDESQAIKNPTSKRYKAVCLLNGNNKLAMTGTPIENNTFDLYAQINFLNPGFLGSQKAFKENFARPIDGETNQERSAELQKLIKPFVLRRTKEQVASELPAKVEDYLYVSMEEGQRKIYDAFRNKYRNYLLNKIETQGLNKSKMYVLEGLIKLRQICDSPELLNEEEDYGTESVKVKELIKQVSEKTGQHKILVFSQFVKMLQVIKGKLDEKGITYEYLDGKCTPKQRSASVEHFQNDDDCRVFLISLKAGGTGLNLTAADYVYLVDPWWNPAVENQAIDRTHRIGQNKKIIAYRMICKDTVEEKILNYQKRKLKIASDIIHTDESFMKSLTKEDISELFR